MKKVSVALLVTLEAKPGKEADVAKFLEGGLAIVEAEPATTAWFAIRMGKSTFGIFDAFPDEAPVLSDWLPLLSGPRTSSTTSSATSATTTQTSAVKARRGQGEPGRCGGGVGASGAA